MTIAELLDQAKALSPQERRELAKLLIDTLELAPEPQADTLEEQGPVEHWKQPVRHLPDELEPFTAQKGENPVGWVKMQRENLRRKGVGDWGE